MKMTVEDFRARVAYIAEQWEARLRPLREPAANGAQTMPKSEPPGNWQTEQLAQLFEESGWSYEEIGAWMSARTIECLKRNDELRQAP